MRLEADETLMDANGMIGHYGNSQRTNKHDDNSQMRLDANGMIGHYGNSQRTNKHCR
jgi:hypothetical protein